MPKLYTESDWKEPEIGRIINTEKEPDVEALRTDIEDVEDSLRYVSEAFKTTFESINLVSSMSSTLSEIKAPTASYFTSLEAYTETVKMISSNIGISRKFIPSMETFATPYGFKASHEVTMEGFKEFIKKLWEKIKEIFNSFFKKINVFLRRLLNYELELDEYEKYLEKLMSMVRREKPGIKDSKILLETNIPVFIAPHGSDFITTDFLLDTGVKKMKNFAIAYENVNKKLFTALQLMADKDIPNIVNIIIDKMKEKKYDYFMADTRGKLEIGEILQNSVIGKLIQSSFGSENAISHKDLPDEVIRDIMHKLDRATLVESRAYPMFEFRNITESLPKNYNCFLIIPDEDSKIIVESVTESNDYVKRHMYPISSANNLVNFYEDYKKFSKSINIKSLDSSVNKTEDSLDKILKLMKDKFEPLYTNFLMSLNVSSDICYVPAPPEGSDIRTVVTNLEENIKKLKVLYKTKGYNSNSEEINKKWKEILDERLRPLIYNLHSSNDRERADVLLRNIIRYIKNDDSYNYTFTDIDLLKPASIEHIIVSISHLTEVMQKIYTENEIVNLTEDQKSKIKRNLKYINDIMVNIITAFKNIIKNIAVKMGAIYTEFRFELVKYLYKTAKLYNHNLV